MAILRRVLILITHEHWERVPVSALAVSVAPGARGVAVGLTLRF